MDVNKVKRMIGSSGVKKKEYWNFKWNGQGYKSIHIHKAQGGGKKSVMNYSINLSLICTLLFFYLDISQLKYTFNA